MIKFKRAGKTLIIEIEHGLFNDEEYLPHEINYDHPYIAKAILNALQTNLNRHLSGIKEKYYNLGWKHAKGKKVGKWQDFYGGWEK